jgi:hypothetical protein
MTTSYEAWGFNPNGLMTYFRALTEDSTSVRPGCQPVLVLMNTTNRNQQHLSFSQGYTELHKAATLTQGHRCAFC